jgi:hypothetical protein
MANFRRRHKKKKEKRKQAMALAAKDWMRGVVALRSTDGVELVVPKAEARRYGTKVKDGIRHHHWFDRAYGGAARSSNGYSLVHLSVRSDTLFRVIHYSNRQASDPGTGSRDAAKFARDLDHATLFDLVLAAESLGNQGLLDLTCHTVADMIRGKSPTQIRAMFGIGPPQGKKTKNKLMTPEQKEALELEERALRALHTVRCHEFTIYDPKHNCFLYTRFFYFCNMAFFDHDKECECYQFFYLFNSSPYSLIYLAI